MTESQYNSLRPEIRTVLQRLRGRIRRYVLLEGTAMVLALLGLLFWVSLAVDWAYFRISALELPVWFRQAFTLLALCLLVAGALAWIAFRVFRNLRMKALALLLERRFPQLDDRLITAVEASELDDRHAPPLTRAMLDRTVDEVARAAGQLELSAVFDSAPLRRAVVLAAVVVTSIGGFAWANQQAVTRWTRAYVKWDSDYWNRDTFLTVQALAQPDDRIKPFRSGVYKHPRGGKLTILIAVPNERPGGGEWIVPRQVVIDYRTAGGGDRGRAFCTPIRDETLLARMDAAAAFEYSSAGLLDGFDFYIKGGDFTNRQPLRVEVVDPPAIDRLELDCEFPPYTGLNADPDAGRIPIQGTQISLPLETRFMLRAAANKPVVGVRLQYDNFEFSIRRFGGGTGEIVDVPQPAVTATLVRRSELGETEETTELPADIAAKLLSPEGRQFQIPLVISTQAEGAVQQRLADDLDGCGPPLVLPPDGQLRIYLEDTDEIISLDPAQLKFAGIVDHEPIVETQLRGIGTSITRKAVIPIAGAITDDYGLEKARFEFRVDDETEWRVRPFRVAPRDRPRDFELARSEDENYERFEVLPLDLTIGQRLTLTVFAEDADDLNGPHATRGERYSFQIVSAEELLALLYRKELNLRVRFEQIIEEVEGVQKNVLLWRAKFDELAALRESNADGAGGEQQRRLAAEIAGGIERGLHQTGKNAGETRAVQAGFQDILEELVNNAVHTRQMVERIEGLIVKPLERIVGDDFSAVDSALREYRFAHERGIATPSHIEAVLSTVDTMLAHMRAVLSEIEELAEFHEAINDLKHIIDQQDELRRATESERKRSNINKLKGLLD